jgi:predicted transcriptional regulator
LTEHFESDTCSAKRTDPKTQQRLDALAQLMGRPRNWLVNQALDYCLDVQAWQIAQIQQGSAAADRGGLVSHDQVMAEVGARILHVQP